MTAVNTGDPNAVLILSSNYIVILNKNNIVIYLCFGVYLGLKIRAKTVYLAIASFKSIHKRRTMIMNNNAARDRLRRLFEKFEKVYVSCDLGESRRSGKR